MEKTEIIPKLPKKDMSWKSFFLILVLIVLFRLFVLEPHSVSGSSMENTFQNSDYVLVDKLSYRFEAPKKGDVIVFNPPPLAENTSRFIKRIIAGPGDAIEVKDGNTYINNVIVPENYIQFKSTKDSTSTVLKADQYFVMGDNRYVSYDSRYWGPIQKNEIQGRVILRLYPFNKIGFFPGIEQYTDNKY
jgi:signal peptidase I